MSDEGPGIPEESMNRVFTRFWRGSKRGGTGLGLYIVKGIVEAHGGTVTVGRAPAAAHSSDLRCPWRHRPSWPEAPRAHSHTPTPLDSAIGTFASKTRDEASPGRDGALSQPIGSTGRDVGTE